MCSYFIDFFLAFLTKKKESDYEEESEWEMKQILSFRTCGYRYVKREEPERYKRHRTPYKRILSP